MNRSKQGIVNVVHSRMAEAERNMSTPVYELSKIELDARLVRLSGPMFVGLAMIAFIHVVDAYAIGRLGTRSLAAFGICIPLIMLLQATLIGLCNGLAAQVAILIGRGEPERASALVGQGSVFMAAGFGLLVWLLGAPLQAELLPLLASDPEQLRAADEYLTAMRCALAILVFPLAATFAFRGLGFTTPSAKVMSLAAVCNLVLAPGLVLGLGPFPALGIAGAGWGTAVANAIGAIYALYLLRSHVRALSLREFGRHLRAVTAVGVPTAAALSLTPLGAMMVVAFADRISLQCVAAVSLLGRVENFLLMYPMAVAASVQPVVGQLWGANRVDAVQSVLATARRIAIRWSLAWSAVLVVASTVLPSLFSDDHAVRASITMGLWFTPLVYAAMSIVMTTGASLVAIGKAPRSLRASATLSLLLIPAFVGAFSTWWGELGLYGGQALAASVAAAVYLRAARTENLIARRPSFDAAAKVDVGAAHASEARDS